MNNFIAHRWMVLAGLILADCSAGAQPVSSPADLLKAESNPGVSKTSELARQVDKGLLETVAAFHESMPTGVTVSREGRIFVNYPRWGDPVPFTVAEVKGGRATAFPNEQINRLDEQRAEETFVSVQSVVVDARDRLWVLDTGSIKMGPTIQNGPKLIGISLADDKVFKTISFPADVALPSTYLNDMRFDLSRGQDGVAYITDSSATGPNGIIVVDLASEKSWRRLHDHRSTKAEDNFVPMVEEKPLMRREAGGSPQPIRVGSDGIAISSDGTRLFYCPLASRRLYSVSTKALLDQTLSDAQVALTVSDEGAKTAADGLESDSEGRLYATDYEHNAIVRRNRDRQYEIIVQDPRMLWPDTMSMARDGFLYFIANQLHRQPDYQAGQDLRQKPYYLFRVRIDAHPVRLDRSGLQFAREKEF